jgi:uncharacterized membrane protein
LTLPLLPATSRQQSNQILNAMSPHFNEGLELALRWAHVFAGILWVGATFYFTWLDGCFEKLAKEPEKPGEKKFVWMVHSGGFYAVEKQKVLIVPPVVFTMISNHYSGTYGSRYNWLILSALMLVGWLAAKLIRRA